MSVDEDVERNVMSNEHTNDRKQTLCMCLTSAQETSKGRGRSGQTVTPRGLPTRRIAHMLPQFLDSPFPNLRERRRDAAAGR